MRKLLVVIGVVVGYAGCGCGVVAVPSGPDAGGSDAGGSGVAFVDSSGVVQFDALYVGGSETFAMPIKDSADTDETIESASMTGDGAQFEVTTSLPLAVPAGQRAYLGVKFAPMSAASFEAQLVLQTAKMGASTITLRGTGLDPTN